MEISSKTIRWGGLTILFALIGVIYFATGKPDVKSPESSAGAESSARPVRSNRPPLPKSEIIVSKGLRYYPAPASSEWQRIAASLDPEKAKAMLERDRLEEKNVNVRAENAYNIINQLCLNGYTDEAWALIDESSGKVRESGLSGFFRDANLPKEELLSRLDTLQLQDRAMGLVGYWTRFTPEEFTKANMADFPLKSANERGAFRSTLMKMIDAAYDPKNPEASKWVRHDLLSLAAAQANAGMFRYGEFAELINKDPSKDGFTQWEVLKTINPELKAGQDSLLGPEAQAIKAMVTQDPEKAMSRATVSGTQEAKFMHVALTEWLAADYDHAERWYQANRGSFDQFFRDRSAVAFMRTAAKRGEYQTALNWYAQLEKDTWISGMRGEKNWIERQMVPKPAGE